MLPAPGNHWWSCVMASVRSLCRGHCELSCAGIPTFCDPRDCSPPGSSVHGDSPGKNTRVGCHALLQGIFPTQGSNPGLPHCGWILYPLSHKGSPLIARPQCPDIWSDILDVSEGLFVFFLNQINI